MYKRSFNELINTVDPAWPLVQQWIADAQNPVEVLKAERSQGKATLVQLQISTRSPMGAIALESGGIFIDHGWLRFLGAGQERMPGSLISWNKPEVLEMNGAFIIAHDVTGGFFALNGGAFPGKQGDTFYLAPDNLRWEPLQVSYSQLLLWAMNGNLALFYEGKRWSGWEHDVENLNGDQGFSIFPLLWAQGPPIAERSRRAVPMIELWRLQLDLAKQLRDVAVGTGIILHLT